MTVETYLMIAAAFSLVMVLIAIVGPFELNSQNIIGVAFLVWAWPIGIPIIATLYALTFIRALKDR